MNPLTEGLPSYNSGELHRLRMLANYLDAAQMEAKSYYDPEAESAARQDFEEDYFALVRDAQEEVREEEMRIAGDSFQDNQRTMDELEARVKDADARAMSSLLNRLSTMKLRETVDEDAEVWAHNDGWNAAIAHIESVLSPNQP